MSNRIFQENRLKSLLLIIPILFFLFNQSPAEATGKSVDRISGANRYGTAVEVSKKGWINGSENVVISVGDNFPDALAGAPFAYSINAPILLTDRFYLPYEVKQEIRRLNAKKAYILGGENVVSTKIEETLKAMGLMVERIKGKNRYETSAAIAEKLNKIDTAVIAFGRNFPDSLSIAAYASQQGFPILLTEKNELPEEIKVVLSKFKQTIVVGGEGVISKKVFNQLPNPRRISGADRYSTSAKIVETFGGSSKKSYIATGQAFSDALTGSVLAAKDHAPVLLVEANKVATEVVNVIGQKDFNHFTIIGGKNVVTDDVLRFLKFDIQSLINTAKALQGVPYTYGGTTPSGFDCSGYINYVYKQHGIELPRTTRDIWNVGTKVSQPSIGDIVFFETYKPGPSHAGIYIGNNEFIHASSSRGVSITSMDNSYFKPRYLGAKRVF
jgi:putative cell wall-binding protein